LLTICRCLIPRLHQHPAAQRAFQQ